MIRQMNAACHFFLELALIIACAVAGAQLGHTPLLRWLWGGGLPLAVVFFWAKWMAPKAEKRLPARWRPVIAFLLFLGGDAGLYLSGYPRWGMVLALIALVNMGVHFRTTNV